MIDNNQHRHRWEIREVLSRCHNVIQEPMDIRQAPGSTLFADPKRVMLGLAEGAQISRAFGPGGREGRILAGGSASSGRSKRVSAVTGA